MLLAVRYLGTASLSSLNEQTYRCRTFDESLILHPEIWLDFVRDQLGSEWITPTLWHGKHLPPLKQRTWPIPFVIKANNGCGWNFFVRQEFDLDWKRIESLTAEWRSRPYGAEWGEWLYGAISPALLVEPFVDDRWEYPYYKLWTFGGKVQIIGVGTDRHSDLKFSMFDSQLRIRLPFKSPLPTDLRPLPKPQSLSRMIEAAEILAEDFPICPHRLLRGQ